LRISGAIQVLEEELKVQPQDGTHNDGAIISDTTETDPSRVNGNPAHVGA